MVLHSLAATSALLQHAQFGVRYTQPLRHRVSQLFEEFAAEGGVGFHQRVEAFARQYAEVGRSDRAYVR